jgi:DNA-binding response OmpR family regulator
MRLLVVEDEVALAEMIARGLAADGFECDVVHDGAEGLWQATTGAYSAVVLDLLLPSMNGFKVCRSLRAEENWTPVLILTAKDGDYDLAEALDCGADDFLSKPFSFVAGMCLARRHCETARWSSTRSPADATPTAASSS